MRASGLPRWLVVAVTVGLAATLVTGVTYAASGSGGFKACADKSNVLVLADKNGNCPKGDQATTIGARGPAGTDGATILSGTAKPSTKIGKVGDYYLRTSNDDLYGPAARTCKPLPCHTLWGTPTSLIGARGAPGQPGQPLAGQVYESTTTGAQQMPNGNSVGDLLIQTIPVAGDYSVVATVDLEHTGNDTTAWICTLEATSGNANETIDSAFDNQSGSSPQTELRLTLAGATHVDAGGTLAVSCSESLAQKNDVAQTVHITSTQVSGITIL
jgi:hypothetical protein